MWSINYAGFSHLLKKYCSENFNGRKDLFLANATQYIWYELAIWYHLYNLKNVKNTHGKVLILVKLQAKASNFTKSNTPPWVFFMFLKLY